MVVLGAAFFVSFVGLIGLGLVLQDLWDSALVGLGGDEDFGEDQQACWLGGLLAFVLLDSS